MKIAFVVSFFDFRNDVRRVIAQVAAGHEVVVMGRADQEERIRRHLPVNVEFREIDERKNTLWNQLWERVYFLFRAAPKSRSNFFLMELFKASNTAAPRQQRKSLRLFHWMQRLPKFIPYDYYLDRLGCAGRTQLADIDRFLFFTAIADDYLLSRLIREKHPRVMVYVYSWDHPCKHTCFSRRVHYAVWNEGMADDLNRLQNIPARQIRITGASQFAYLHEFNTTYKSRMKRTFDFPYVYFGCATGIPELVTQEIAVIRLLAEELARVRPDLRLVVRPYPVQRNWEVYGELRRLENVVFDDGFRNTDLSVREEHLMEKFEKTDHALAFFHIGTTMGLETCFTSTPSFILDLGYESRSGLHLRDFIHQYQNQRHLINLAPQNVIKDKESLAAVLSDTGNKKYLLLNRLIQQKNQLLSFKQISKNLA